MMLFDWSSAIVNSTLKIGETYKPYCALRFICLSVLDGLYQSISMQGGPRKMAAHGKYLVTGIHSGLQQSMVLWQWRSILASNGGSMNSRSRV